MTTYSQTFMRIKPYEKCVEKWGKDGVEGNDNKIIYTKRQSDQVDLVPWILMKSE